MMKQPALGEKVHVGGIAVVLPCWNEQTSIRPMVDELKRAVKEIDEPITALFIDDGSTDATWERIRQAAAELAHDSTSSLRVIGLQLDGHLGKGAAHALGLRYASEARIVVLMDSDGQHPANMLPDLIGAVQEHRTAAIGARTQYRRGMIAGIGTRGLGLGMRILGTRFDPTLSEFIAVPRETAAVLARSPRLGVAPLVPLVQSSSPNYRTIPISINERFAGSNESRWTFASLWQKALLQLLADPWRLFPRITILAVLSFLLLTVIAIVAGVHAISQGTSPGTVAILAAVVISAAITVGMAVASMVVSVMTLQSIAGLHESGGVRETISSFDAP